MALVQVCKTFRFMATSTLAVLRGFKSQLVIWSKMVLCVLTVTRLHFYAMRKSSAQGGTVMSVARVQIRVL